MHKQDKLSQKDLLEAIKRSGYLFESEISNMLAKVGFFIESNQVIEDPITRKSREIDLTAEYYNEYDKEIAEYKASAKIKFVFEIKNNIYHLVLMTKFEFSPNIEIWESLKEIQTAPKGIDWNSSEGFYEKLLENNVLLYTQYCSFSHKKGQKNKELVALHPEHVYAGLSKITQYCEEEKDLWDDRKIDEYYRKFLYLPVLLIKDDLYELQINNKSNPKLHKVDESKLVFNYYFKGDLRISTIFVVTQKGIKKFMEKMIKLERMVEEEMIITIKQAK
jgi:uncharacterized metal-binding protein